MAKKKKSSKKKTKKEKVEEIFEIEKEGKEKIVSEKGNEEIKIETKTQIESQNKQLKYILLTIGLFFLLTMTFFFVSSLKTNFEYEGMKFNVIKEGNLIFYQTSFPTKINGKPFNYNFFIRNDPRKLDKIDFEGELSTKDFLVWNYTDEFHCEGDGTIAIANVNHLYEFMKIKVLLDPNATCDEEDRYMFVNILPGEKTKIEQFGPSCYNIYVKNCEILEATERFMVETFIQLNSENEI
jgi:hypothetical protein